MNRRFNSTQRNYIIAGLCMILVIMGVGYAAFSSQLKISGTSNITSNWNVKITNIQSKVVSGAPTDAETPDYTDTTATFKTRLTSPGDTMQYDVTVSNEGDIDAKLDRINVPESTNPAIGFEVSGIKEGSLLEAKQSAILTVIVKYNDVTEQPSDLTADLEVTLDYSQAPDGYIPPAPTETIGGQKVELVESGDGLYEDEYEKGKYTYKGANPNNYITFNNEMWRIISIDSTGLIKIMRNKSIGYIGWDSSNNNWARPATLNTYLNEEYLEILSDSDKIISHTWNIGPVTQDNNDLVNQINDEKGTTWNGKVGLITASEYLRANTNTEQCSTYMLNRDNFSICKTTDWMHAIVSSTTTPLWTVSPIANHSAYVVNIGRSGALLGYGNDQVITYPGAVSPVVYLSSDITLTGEGTEASPYRIIA